MMMTVTAIIDEVKNFKNSDMKKLIFLFLFSITGVVVSAQSGKGVLQHGATVPVKFAKSVSSDNSQEAVAQVAVDVLDSEGNKLIALGTPVEISLARTPAKSVGKGGNISLSVKSTRAVDGQLIDLSGSKIVNGKNRSGAAWTLTGVGCFVIPPLNFLFLLMKGKPAIISEKDTITDVHSATSYTIKISGSSGTSTSQTSENQMQYRGGGDPLKGLNVNKTNTLQIGDYYALIIGIDKYKGSWQPLKNAVRDAKAVESLLKEEYKFDYFKTLTDEQATRKNIISEMEWLVKNVKEKDNVLIYYSGHGEYKQDLNKGYWVPIDAQSTSTSDYVSNNDIQTFLSGIKSKHTLLISDACFSGDIFRGNTIAVPFENSERYYRDVHNLSSRQALTSGGIEPVMDGGKEGHSVFAYYLLKALINNQNKFYDASQLYSTIKIPVTNNSEQSPQFQSVKNTGDEGGQFIFIKK